MAPLTTVGVKDGLPLRVISSSSDPSSSQSGVQQSVSVCNSQRVQQSSCVAVSQCGSSQSACAAVSQCVQQPVCAHQFPRMATRTTVLSRQHPTGQDMCGCALRTPMLQSHVPTELTKLHVCVLPLSLLSAANPSPRTSGAEAPASGPLSAASACCFCWCCFCWCCF